MSKKVAQLTKVIYHLNTKNEDNEAALHRATSHHRLELQSLRKQQHAKLQRLVSLEKELDLARQRSAQLLQQHEDSAANDAELQRTREELQESFTAQQLRAEKALKAAFDDRLSNELDAQRSAHEAR